MKIAVTGKGGAGKTTTAGSLARHLARLGHPVVALDCDPSPTLGITLGMSADEVTTMVPVLNGLQAEGHTHHDPKPDPQMLLDRFGIPTADGVLLLASGRIEEVPDSCMCCGSHKSAQGLFSDLPAAERFLVADLEAGLNDLLWANPQPDDVVVVVSEPSAKSLEVARRAAGIAAELGVTRIIAVANRADGPNDAALLAATTAGPVVTVPYDPSVARADQLGRAPMDTDPGSPAMAAIAGLADLLAAPRTTQSLSG